MNFIDITATEVWVLLLRKVLVGSFRRPNRNFADSSIKKEDCVLTPDAISYFEKIIASKNGEMNQNHKKKT